jgi:general stress protein 26
MTANPTAQSLAKLVEKIDIAMFTTVGPGGYLVSRPLSTQAARFDGERVWFFVDARSPKVDEIRRNRKVNVSYASQDRNTYVSLAGDARLDRDRARIASFWNDALKAFFPKGMDDPDLALIEVRPRTAEYWDGPGSFLGKAISFVVARVTGNDDAMGENRIVDLSDGRKRRPPSSDTRPRQTKAAVAQVSRPLTGAGKAAAKKAPARKAAATRAVATRAMAKQAVAKKAVAKKAVAKKAVAKKAVAKQAAAKKSVAKKSVAKKAPAGKVARRTR